MSRREAAVLLGFSSEFKVRQLEKGGRLHAVRGAMNQAWYPRSEVLGALDPGGAQRFALHGPMSGDRSAGLAQRPGIRRCSDSDLIAYLRGYSAPTVVDLVADTGISIARAQRVYRFWLANEGHAATAALLPATGGTAARPRTAGAEDKPRVSAVPAELRQEGGAGTANPRRSRSASPTALPPAVPSPPRAPAVAAERRGDERIERDRLIQQLRDADPVVRASAFEKLKNRPRPR